MFPLIASRSLKIKGRKICGVRFITYDERRRDCGKRIKITGLDPDLLKKFSSRLLKDMESRLAKFGMTRGSYKIHLLASQCC